MSLIHLQNQVVFERELAAKSWCTYMSYELDDSTHEIVTETVSVFYDRDCPGRSSQKRRGRLRIPLDQAPPGLAQQVEEIFNLPDQTRETTTMHARDTTVMQSAGKQRTATTHPLT